MSGFTSFAKYLSRAKGEKARVGGIERPEESQSPRSRGAFQRVYEFSPFNEIPRKWIVTKYFRGSFIIDQPILISHVSIATTRTYDLGHVGPLYDHIRVCTPLVCPPRECIACFPPSPSRHSAPRGLARPPIALPALSRVIASLRRR